MNIFRPKYRLIKERLRSFGESIKSKTPRVLYDAEFWRERLDSLQDKNSWDYVITAYLAYWCTDEELLFIDNVFFKQLSIKTVSDKLYISEVACHTKREKIMDCILGLAMQQKLVVTDMTNGHLDREIVCAIDQIISDAEWDAIKGVLASKDKRAVRDAQNVIEAIVYVLTTHIPWRELPLQYGLWKSVYNRYNRWKKSGLWNTISNIIDFDI